MKALHKLIFFIIILCPLLLIGAEKDSLSISKIEFIKNKGQWSKQVQFMANISSGSIWLEKKGLLIDLYDISTYSKLNNHKVSNGNKINGIPKKINKHAYRIKFQNCNSEAELSGNHKLTKYNNYFLGSDKNKWQSNVPIFEEINYTNLYNGIDFKIYENNGYLKWDFIIKPMINSEQIKLSYVGVDKIKIKNGNLIITTSVNKVTELKPIAYQNGNNGNQINIECRFKLENNIVSFEFPNSYDKSKELIIDPTLVFASYSGSTADNWGFTATYDNQGYLYAGGIAFSVGNYPTTTGAYDASFNGIIDVAISKYDTTGSFMIYSTYLGGSLAEVPASLVVNSSNELLVLGTTASTNFPTTNNAYDASFNGGSTTSISSTLTFTGGSDLFITHFSHNGNQLVGSTYLGGSGNDGLISSNSLVKNYGDDIRGEILTDQNDNVFIVSTSKSTNFPTTLGVFQPTKSTSNDGIIAKLDNHLSNLIWASYFGGTSDDAIYGLKVNSTNDIYITGGTMSNDLATTTGVYQSTYGGNIDGFVAKIDNSGQNIMHCSYIGSNRYDQSYLIDLDKYDNVYLFGQTLDTSNTFIFNAIWNSPKDGQFLIKLIPNLSTRVWATTWGNGSPGIDIVPSAFMVDLCNRVYLSAWGGAVNNTNAGFAGGSTTNLPITANAIQSTTDGSDYYLMVMTDDASALDYGSYFGGSQSHEHVDGGTSRFDNKGRIYQNVCAGCGNHNDFPTTTGCHSSTNNSQNCNNGVFKVDFNIPAIVADYIIPPVVCIPDTSHFENTSFLSHPNLTQYSWDFGDGTTSSTKSPNHIYTQSGIYNVELVIYDPQSCNLRDTINKQVVVLSGNVDTLTTKYICPGDYTQIGILPIADTSVHFLWTPNLNLSNNTVSNPYASPNTSTWYTMVMDNNSCADTFHQKVEFINLSVDAGNDTTICINTITLTGTSNTTPANYVWSSNSVFSDTLNNYPTGISFIYTYTGPAYLYFMAESHGCYGYDSILIDQRILISPTQIQTPLCNGDTNGTISITAQGAAPPITYVWSNGQSSSTISNLAAGNYALTITDGDGCIAKYDTTLLEPAILISDSISKSIPCPTACIGKAYANVQGGTTPYSWQWNDGNSQSTNPAVLLCAGRYLVTITDANNCLTYDSVTIIDSSLYINFLAWSDRDTIYEGERIALHSTNLGLNYIYRWTPSANLINSTTPNPIATPKTTTTYIIEVHDYNGCSWTDSITIYVTDVICEEPYIYVPNAFTPNGDGKNDILFVESSVGYDINFQVYDRWGELVFQTDHKDNGWNGFYKGKKLEAGVYVYYLYLTCYNNEVFIKKGNITLIR